jgi:hypothetical protein
VTKLAPSGAALVYSTYLFGELDDAGSRIAVDAAGHAHVVGATNSANFPIVGAFQSRNRGLDDAFVAELSADGRRLLSSSYFGGSRSGPSARTGVDEGISLALDPSGNTWIVGYTQSYDLGRPRVRCSPRSAPDLRRVRYAVRRRVRREDRRRCSCHRAGRDARRDARPVRPYAPRGRESRRRR